MSWTIEAKVYPIAVFAGHLYYEIWDDKGKRVMQINGLATDPITGQVHTAGSDSDILKIYAGGIVLGGTGDETQYNSTHNGVILFTGSKEDVFKAIDYLNAAASYSNEQQLSYSILASGDDKYNSNSAFNSLANVLMDVLPIDIQKIND